MLEDDLVGTVLDGRFRIDERLGEGGMASVYLARQETLHRNVVVKVPHASLLGEPEFAARFDRELRKLAELRHPRIVAVLEAGEFEGTPYFVMEHLSGGTLGDRLQRGSAESPKRVADWLTPVAEALDFIHGMGVIHRDVKPGNVLFDVHGNVFLADFGLVKALGGEDTGLTKTGSTLGTVLYMAPEAGMEKPLTRASDQYGLGVMTYEALCGELPFEGETPYAVIVSKMNEDPAPVGPRCPELPVRAADAVMRAISRDPDERYFSCTEFARAFAAGASAPPPADSPPAARVDAEDIPERSGSARIGKGPFLLGAVSVVVAALIFVLMSGRGVDATFVFPVAPRLVTLDSGAGAPVRLVPEPGQDRVTLEGIAPGVYRISTRLGEFERLAAREIRVSPDRTEYELPIYEFSRIRVDPSNAPFATLEISVVKSGQETWRNRFGAIAVELGREDLEPIDVPAGPLRVRIRKDGYREFENQVWFPPGEAGHAWVIPKLVPMLGTLTLPATIPGAVVTVRDRFGEFVLEEEVPASGVLSAKLVAGRHRLEIRHPHLRPFGADVEIREDEELRVELPLVPLRARLVVTAPPGSAYWIEMHGGPRKKHRLAADEYTRSHELQPGIYQVLLDGASETVRVVQLDPGYEAKVDLLR